ncbi:MAG: energy-coupling factor ABC transporter ATP-binding protein [Armatimonadota bacterium]
MNGEIVVDVKCLEHVYPGGTRVDVCGLEFEVLRGQRIAILGPNGSGKTTLLKHVLGLLTPTRGNVSVFGKDPARQHSEIRQRIGALMQNVDEQLIGPTVFDDVAFAPLNFGFSREETYQRVEEMLHALGIYHLRDRLPHYLSGGERKKVALAGALVFGPDLLVLDEPMSGIDCASRRDIVRFLNQLHRETGMTMITAMHDMELVGQLADYGYVMRQSGRLELEGTVLELFFEHDLAEYNLEPPTVVQLTKSLQRNGVNLQHTLDMQDFEQQLLQLIRK